MDSRLKLIIKGDPEEVLMLLVRLKNPTVSVPYCLIIAQFGDVITCRVKRKYLFKLYNSPDIFSVKAPRLIPAPLHTENIIAGYFSIDNFNLSRRLQDTYTGKGVYFAAVDWGFDIAHVNLRKKDGTTKFKYIWNQNGLYDNNSYGYGCFYSQEDINKALNTDTPYQTLGYHPGRADAMAVGMHGTHVIDIATGTPIVGEGGVAPDATLIGVELGTNFVNGSDLALGDSVRLVEALHFIYQNTKDAPCVINMSLGSHGDSHTGKSLVEIAIDNLLYQNAGFACVQSVGNYYLANCHAQYKLRHGETYSLEWNIQKNSPLPNKIEVWYSGADEFSIELVSPNGDIVTTASPFTDMAILLQGKAVGYIFHRAKEPNTGLNHIELILDISVLKGKWLIQLIGSKVIDGTLHAYSERNDTGQAKFSKHQSSSFTTTGSVCNSVHTIAVGAYNHLDLLKPVVAFSSSGPTVTGQIKPDLLAPGYKILAAKSAPISTSQANNELTTKSGSSMAAPHVAGAIVLLFQKYLPERVAITKTKELLLSALDPLLSICSKNDGIRAGKGYLNINKLLKLNNSMNINNFTRPFRRQEDDFETEEYVLGDTKYHAPYFHTDCIECEKRLIENIKEGDFLGEKDLLATLNNLYFNEKNVDDYSLYRHFHPSYQFNNKYYNDAFLPVATPKKRFSNNLRAGDIILMRIALSGKTRQAIIIDAEPITNEELNSYLSNSNKNGKFVRVYGNMMGNGNDFFYLRIADTHNIAVDNLLVLRKMAMKDNNESLLLTEDSPLQLTTKRPFILKYATAFVSACKNTGLFPSVMMAQAILETGWGKSRHAQSDVNNLFGIKSDMAWPNKVISSTTSEEINHQKIRLYGTGIIYVDRDNAIAKGADAQTLFRVYDTVEQGINDRITFLQKNIRYSTAGVFSAKNWVDQVSALLQAGYATETDYGKQITDIIKQNKLEELDDNNLQVTVMPKFSKPSIISLSDAVGRGKKNLPEDVTKVQQLLNQAGLTIPITGYINDNEGDTTILAIYHYQKIKNLKYYDGQVNVDGITLKSLASNVKGITSDGEMELFYNEDAIEVPALILPRENNPASETLYVAIDLGLKKECKLKDHRTWKCVEWLRFDVEAKTGIFIPANFKVSEKIDLFIYLHGHKSGYVQNGKDLSINQLWDKNGIEPKFAFREILNNSGKNMILVAPTLGPLSQAGTLTTDAGFSSFIMQVLTAISAYSNIVDFNNQLPEIGCIILAAHSGGGEPLRKIAKLSAINQFANKIKECWGFDCTYSSQDPDGWHTWAKLNPNKSLYIYYGSSTAAIARELKVKKDILPNIFVEPSKAPDHNSVPSYYMPERLRAINCLTESYGEAEGVYSDEFEEGAYSEENVVVFPSGEQLDITTGDDGPDEEFFDPNYSGNLLLDTSAPNKNKLLSTNIKVSEIAQSGGVHFDKARIDPELIRCLQAIRDYVGKPISINSGYRSYAHNKKLSGKSKNVASHSQHMSGRASDIKIEGMSGFEIAKAAIDAYGCNIGIGLAPNFAHIDVRGHFAVWRYHGDPESINPFVLQIKEYQKQCLKK